MSEHSNLLIWISVLICLIKLNCPNETICSFESIFWTGSLKWTSKRTLCSNESLVDSVELSKHSNLHIATCLLYWTVQTNLFSQMNRYFETAHETESCKWTILLKWLLTDLILTELFKRNNLLIFFHQCISTWFVQLN